MTELCNLMCFLKLIYFIKLALCENIFETSKHKLLLQTTLSFQPGQIDGKTKPPVTYHALIVNLIRNVGRQATSWWCRSGLHNLQSTGPYTCRGALGAEGKGRITSQHNTLYCSSQIQKYLFHIICHIFTKKTLDNVMK